MTDNEIIKALERCQQHTECCYCNSLEECSNKRILTTSVFDHSKRQNAEIESLKHRKTELQIRNQELQHEKSEAIKEFAKELKNCFAISGDYLDIINIIENLVKEMTEVEE